MPAAIEENKKIEKKLVAGIDVDKLIKRAQENYEKKETGLAKQLATGTTISTPTEDSDFVLWQGGDHWQKLTHMRGLPFGRICQISGKSDSGKSTHSQAFMKYAQDQDVLVINWDAERKMNRFRFKDKIGGNPDNLIVINTNKTIDGVRAIAHLINSAKEINPNIKILITIDSIGALLNSTEDREEENEHYSVQPGVSAKENAYMMRKLNKLINRHMDKETGKHTIAVLLINQVYANIGSVGQTEKGGTEVYYLSSLIIQLSRKQDLTRTKNGEKYKYGILSRAKVKKNHIAESDESIAELDIVVSAAGIQLASDVKSFKDIEGWDNKSDAEDE